MEDRADFNTLQADLAVARRNRYAASRHFDDVISHVPSGIPYPDNVDRIRQASREYNDAQRAVLLATSRLNEFLANGTVPERIPEAKETADPPDGKIG